MSEYEYDDDGSSLVKDLRAQLKELKAENISLKSEVDTFRTETRQATVSELVKARGLNPKVAKLVPADMAGDDIAAWLDDYADVFGVAPVEGEAQSASTPDPEQVEAANRINNLAEGGSSPTRLQDMESRINAATTAEEIQQILAEAREYVL